MEKTEPLYFIGIIGSAIIAGRISIYSIWLGLILLIMIILLIIAYRTKATSPNRHFKKDCTHINTNVKLDGKNKRVICMGCGEDISNPS